MFFKFLICILEISQKRRLSTDVFPPDALSPGRFVSWTFCPSECFVTLDVLSRGRMSPMFCFFVCPSGRLVSGGIGYCPYTIPLGHVGCCREYCITLKQTVVGNFQLYCQANGSTVGLLNIKRF